MKDLPTLLLILEGFRTSFLHHRQKYWDRNWDTVTLHTTVSTDNEVVNRKRKNQWQKKILSISEPSWQPHICDFTYTYIIRISPKAATTRKGGEIYTHCCFDLKSRSSIKKETSGSFSTCQVRSTGRTIQVRPSIKMSISKETQNHVAHSR